MKTSIRFGSGLASSKGGHARLTPTPMCYLASARMASTLWGSCPLSPLERSGNFVTARCAEQDLVRITRIGPSGILLVGQVADTKSNPRRVDTFDGIVHPRDVDEGKGICDRIGVHDDSIVVSQESIT